MNSEPFSKPSDTKIDTKDQLKSIQGHLDELIEMKMIDFMTMNQLKSDTIEHLNHKITKVENDLAELKELLEDESIKFLKAGMKDNLQIQKDCMKSNLSIKQEISEVKQQLYMVYGKEFFNRKK